MVKDTVRYYGFPICLCGGQWGNTTYTMPHIHLPAYSRTSVAPGPVKVGEALPHRWLMSEAGGLWSAGQEIPWT